MGMTYKIPYKLSLYIAVPAVLAKVRNGNLTRRFGVSATVAGLGAPL